MENLTYENSILFLTTNSGVGVEIGSGCGINTNRHTLEESESELKELINHNFVDWEFVLNYTDEKKDFTLFFNEIMLPQIKENFGTYFYIKKTWMGDVISLKNDFRGYDNRKKIDTLFQNFIVNHTNQTIFNDYKSYKLRYCGEEI